MILTVSAIAALCASASAYDLPENLRSIYDAHKVRPTSPSSNYQEAR